MTLSQLEEQVPALLEYTKNMPEDIRSRCVVRIHPAGSIIHQKNMELHSFGIDANILRLAAWHTAFKLYRSSYNNGAKLFYPPAYILLDYLVRYGRSQGMDGPAPPREISINRTRQALQEEMGINVKTLNRTIRQLKEEGFLSLCKGKIVFDRSQYQRAFLWLETKKGE